MRPGVNKEVNKNKTKAELHINTESIDPFARCSSSVLRIHQFLT